MSELSGSFISIDESNKNTSKSSIQQLVDIVQSDIASISSTTRKSYEVFVSGGINLHPITSSLYQTVFDQDFTLGTANPLFDITMGSLEEVSQNAQGETIATVNGISASYDAGGKLTGFGNDTAMMREKVNVYKQFAQNLLGDSNEAFVSPHGEIPPDTPSADPAIAIKEAKSIKGAVFLCFRRLFTRDNIFKGSYGIKLHKKASLLYSDFVSTDASNRQTGTSISNINIQADLNSTDGNTASIYDDRISTTNMSVSPIAGEVSTLMDSNSNPIGLVYYDSGIIVLDVERAFDSDQIIRGLIDSTRQNSVTYPSGDTTEYDGPFYVYGSTVADGAGYFYPVYTSDFDGSNSEPFTDLQVLDKDNNAVNVGAVQFYHNASTSTRGSAVRPTSGEALFVPNLSDVYYSSELVKQFSAGDGKSQINESFYPGLWTKGTVDDVLDHVCTTRFGRGNLSAISFRNETVINSSLIFCRAAPSQLNYSTNPTYKDSDGNIVALNSNNEPFSFVTTVGLYDADRFLLAVAKTSRPIEKNPETDLSIRIRLDY
jgi:hypothetical protein